MQIGNKLWSCAPGTIATEISTSKALATTGTKSLTIVDDGFIPRDVVQLSEIMRGRTEDGLDSNVVMAPVAWIMRTFPDAIARVERRGDDGEWDWVERHDVQRLIKKPNAWYNGDALWQATSLSYVLNGNAYWQKVRNRFGRVIQLWYRPHWLVTPHSPPDGSAFIDYYEHQTGRAGSPERVPVRDMVHFRFGLDPRDPRLGFGQLRPLLREMFTDQEAARFSIRILENMGIPGVVVSPTLNPTGDSFEPNRDEVEALKEYIQTSFTGNGRGSTLVFGQPTTVTQFGFDPKQLSLSELRDGVEERVCAMLGIPASVVGFGSGMDQTKIGAVMEQHVKLAWKQCLFPMQRALARQLDDQLLADFVPDYEDRERVAFDLSEAASLKESPAELSERVCREVEAGILTVAQAQRMLGLEVDDSQEVYLRAATSLPWPANEVPEMLTEPMAPPGADEDDTPAKVVAALDDWVRKQGVAGVIQPEVVDPGITDLATEAAANGNGHHMEGSEDVAA